MVLRGWLGLGLMACGLAAAQDMRTVTEPRLPPVCKVLTASLAQQNGVLPDSVERHYRDTERLEKAMRHCPAGTSVALRVGDAGKNVFLLGPTRMSAGVTIVVDAGVAIWGSRDPRNYDIVPGSCGIVGEDGPGCRPLFCSGKRDACGHYGGWSDRRAWRRKAAAGERAARRNVVGTGAQGEGGGREAGGAAPAGRTALERLYAVPDYVAQLAERACIDRGYERVYGLER